MTRTVTYSQFDRLLGALGFEPGSSESPSLVYRHQESGAVIVLPRRPSADAVANADLHSARRHLVERGLLDGEAFDEFTSTGAVPVNR
jgi:hypothetical protein